jgi:hypothetical protein
MKTDRTQHIASATTPPLLKQIKGVIVEFVSIFDKEMENEQN